jgi:hypothetical protein
LDNRRVPEERMKNYSIDKTISQDDVLKEFGFSENELKEGMDDVEIE